MTSEREMLLKVDQAAEALSVTPACIRRWILEEKITFVKVGRLVRIPETEVERIIRAGLHPAK